MAQIKTVAEFNAALESGPYAWPGGYPLYFTCADGEALSFESAKENAELIREAITDAASLSRDQWLVIDVDVNWEDSALYCAHSNERIESAYAEDKAK